MDPWLEAAAIGLLGVLIGLAFTFWGFRLFLILLPIWGFFAGFLFGAGATSALFGDGFLATTLGWVIGFVVGIIFAVLSYLYYWFAVVFLGASLGYAAGVGLLHWLGNGGDNFMGFLFGLIGAVIVAAIVVVLRMPKYIAIVLTAIGGAAATITGIALILKQVTLDELSGNIAGSIAAINDLPWLWGLGGIVLAGVGIAYQIRLAAMTEEIVYESYRNPGMPASSPY
ncbi:MAG: DUF4203 domain-containing protein [Chloroflexota bacterium]